MNYAVNLAARLAAAEADVMELKRKLTTTHSAYHDEFSRRVQLQEALLAAQAEAAKSVSAEIADTLEREMIVAQKAVARLERELVAEKTRADEAKAYAQTVVTTITDELNGLKAGSQRLAGGGAGRCGETRWSGRGIYSTMTTTDKIDYVLDRFDFDRVHDAMKAMNWTWGGEDAVPSTVRLRAKARTLLEWALARDGEYYASTGGLVARSSSHGDLTLEFVVESATSFE